MYSIQVIEVYENLRKCKKHFRRFFVCSRFPQIPDNQFHFLTQKAVAPGIIPDGAQRQHQWLTLLYPSLKRFKSRLRCSSRTIQQSQLYLIISANLKLFFIKCSYHYLINY